MNFLGLAFGVTKVEKANLGDVYDLDTIGGRLSYLIKFRKTTQTAIANAIGVKPQTIQYLCKSKNSKSRYITDIAVFLDVNPVWLDSGIGKMVIPSTTTIDLSVPLLKFEEIGEFVCDNQKTSNKFITIPASDEDKDKYSFAIIIDAGDVNSGFDVGTLLIFSIKDEYNSSGYFLSEQNGSYSVKKFTYKNNSFYYKSNHEVLSVEESSIIAKLLESRVSYQD